MPDDPRSTKDQRGPEGAPPKAEDRNTAAELRTGSGAASSAGVGSLGGAGRYAGLGIQFALSILLFLWAGQWLDGKLGTDPLFLFVGAFGGAGAAFYAMYRTLMADQRRREREKR